MPTTHYGDQMAEKGSNASLMGISKQEPLETILRRKRLTRLGYVIRMDNESIPNTTSLVESRGQQTKRKAEDEGDGCHQTGPQWIRDHCRGPLHPCKCRFVDKGTKSLSILTVLIAQHQA